MVMRRIGLLGLALLMVAGCDAASRPGDDAPPPTAQPAAPEVIVLDGDSLGVGLLRYRVTRVVVSRGFAGWTPSKGGIYLVVEYEIENRSDRQEPFDDAPPPSLRDGEGRALEADERLTGILRAGVPAYSQTPALISPGVTAKAAVVFEVAEAPYRRGRWLWTVLGREHAALPAATVPPSPRVAVPSEPQPPDPDQLADDAASAGMTSRTEPETPAPDQ